MMLSEVLFRQFCRRCTRRLTEWRSRSLQAFSSSHFGSLSHSTVGCSQLVHRQPQFRCEFSPKSLCLSRPCSLFGVSDTVFALSSGHGKCGVAVVRTTGPQSKECVLELTGMPSLPTPRKAVLRKLLDPKIGDAIDHALVLWFPAPHSFTGEDCAEFHVHGGPSVVLALLTALGKIPQCSHAQAGDFTKRAFVNGKLELTEVEGLADLIHAETEAQRKQALRQMEGDLGKLYAEWTERLLKAVAHVEAVIDFGEDENIEDTVMEEGMPYYRESVLRSSVESLLREIDNHLNDGRRGERLRSGVHVAILGAPNAGKSSLLNILCQRPAAIVSPYAGTTRDVVESALDIGGYPVVLSDTAGLRHAADPVEQEGVRRALNRVESADLHVLIADLSLVAGRLVSGLQPLSLSQLASHLLQSSSDNECSTETDSWTDRAVEHLSPEDTIVVLNKMDLLEDCGSNVSSEVKSRLLVEPAVESSLCWLSCRTGDGVPHFIDTFTSHLQQLCGNPMAGNPSITQARHRQHLTLCADLLNNFLSLEESGAELLDQAAEELRMAIREVGRITGKVGIEDILDVVFSDFCIGK